MNKDVLITIKGMQGDILDRDVIEMMTTGSHYLKNGNHYFHYIDTALDTDKETKTSIKVSADKIAITRFGASNTHMIFENGISHFSPYETPFGIFEIKTHTNSIQIEETEHTLKLSVQYILEIDKMSSGVSAFELTAKDLL